MFARAQTQQYINDRAQFDRIAIERPRQPATGEQPQAQPNAESALPPADEPPPPPPLAASNAGAQQPDEAHQRKRSRLGAHEAETKDGGAPSSPSSHADDTASMRAT